MSGQQLAEKSEQKRTTHLAAISPSELVTAQMGVLDHCVARINKLQVEQVEAEQSLECARNGCWNTKPFRSRIYRIKRKIQYYKKIGAAVNKGYLIIPDVWGSDVFAIRVKSGPSVRWTKYGNANIQKLPIGEGKYVDATPIRHYRDVEIDGEWKPKLTGFSADEEIDFPVTAVHPSVIKASQIAMADKIFDSLKIARQGGDPFILGEIVDSTQSYGKSIQFFIAWFLDVDSI